MKTVKTCELEGAALDWAVALCEGVAMREPVRATYADVEGWQTPFTLKEVQCVYNGRDEIERIAVKDVTVTRCGIDHAVGATAPSISFVGSDGRKARGSVDMFFLSEEEAALEVQAMLKGHLEYFHPSTNWRQAGPIIERLDISIVRVYNGLPSEERGALWFATRHAHHIPLKRLDDGRPTSPYFMVDEDHKSAYGPTPLIAAMRCYVAFKLGQEVQIPEDLPNV